MSYQDYGRDIGRRIRQRRTSLGLTQGEVVKIIERDALLRRTRGDIERDTISESHLSRLERGRAGDLKMDRPSCHRSRPRHTLLLVGGRRRPKP